MPRLGRSRPARAYLVSGHALPGVPGVVSGGVAAVTASAPPGSVPPGPVAGGVAAVTVTAPAGTVSVIEPFPLVTLAVLFELNVGGTWTDITSKVTGTTLNWNGITLAGSNTLMLKVTDNAGNDGAAAGQAAS